MAEEAIIRKFTVYEDAVETALSGLKHNIKTGSCDDAYTWFLEIYEFFNRCIALASICPQLKPRVEQIREKYTNAKREFESICKMKFVAPGSNPGVFVEIHMSKDAPPITGSDMKTYGPFRKGRVYAIPKANARVFIKHGIAKATRKEAEKPTLKEMFKGEVLDPYIEATKVKALVDEEVEDEGLRKAKERAEKLLKEIQEARGE